MNDKIMIVGGGIYQVPLIASAKKAGYIVVLCDYDVNCPGHDICDIFKEVSIYSQDELLAVAEKEHVGGVLSNSEPILHIISYISDHMGIPSVPYDVTQRYLNKYLMRDWLSPLGLSDVRYKACDDVEDAIGFFRDIHTKKAIMKPLDNSASRGVCSVISENDIRDNFAHVTESNRRQHSVLIEEYIDGTEFTVDGLCVDGKHTTLAISRKKHYLYNENIACELFFSYTDPDYDYDELRYLNNKVAEAGGLNFGMTHAEYKYSNGKFHLIEIAARGGGAYISTSIVPYLTNVDTVSILIDCAMGKHVEYTVPSESQKRTAVLKFFSTPNDQCGYIKSIRGEDYLASCKSIRKYQFKYKVGDYIEPADDDSHRIGYYIAFGESRAKLESVMKNVEEKFVIELDDSRE